MNYRLVIALAAVLLLGATTAGAAEDGVESARKRVIALQTDEFELQETDISHLAVGESETIVTDGGQTIDLLRTGDGVEIYIDGELLEPALHGDPALHGEHEVIHKRVEVICEEEGSCEKLVWASDDADIDLDMLSEVDHEVIMLHDAHVDAEHVVELAPGEHAEKIIIIREKVETD